MTKQEFIKHISYGLAVLNDTEISDIVNEYSQHIDNKIKEGMTEDEAVATLGEPDLLIKDVLSAYNVNPDYNNGNINIRISGIRDIAKNTFSGFFNMISSIGDYILNQGIKNCIKILIRAIIMFVLLWIVFSIGYNIIYNTVACLISNILFGSAFVRGLVMLIYIVVAIPVCVYIFIKLLYRYINNSQAKKENSAIPNTKDDFSPNITNSYSGKITAEQSCPVSSKSGVKLSSQRNNINPFIMLCLKTLVILCLIPYFFTIITTIIAMGAAFIAIFFGFPTIGISLALIGFNISALALLMMILKFVFTDKRS